MAEAAVEQGRWTVADLEELPDRLDGTRYEIIDGELFVSTRPHAYHQRASLRLAGALDAWCLTTGAGSVFEEPGIVLTDEDSVAPDIAWFTPQSAATMDEAGHFPVMPELAVEVLSPGPRNEGRDRRAKFRLYEMYGVQEYWIINWRLQQVAVYRREQGRLNLAATLLVADELTSPLLPGFVCPVAHLFRS